MTSGSIPVTAVLIPVYNHAQTLREVVAGVLSVRPIVIVVDDGSTDGGADTLAGLPVSIVRHDRNRGKGFAIRTGAAEAMRMGCTHIVTMDADGQHMVSDLPVFLGAIKEHPESVIVGARDFTVPNVPSSSKFGRKFSWFWMFVQTGVSVSDMQSGFRAYPLKVLDSVHCVESRYSFEIEVLVRTAWAGFSIREIPVQVWYPPREERVSHFRAVADNVRISLLNTRLTIRALTPLPFRRTALDVEGRLSLRHPFESIFHLLRMEETPAGLARSAAWSAFISAIPLLGLQSMILLYVINRLKLNRLCALLIVPLTWPPVVPGLSVLAGYRIINGRWLTEFSIQTLGHEAGHRFVDWMAGSLVLSPILATVLGCVVFIVAVCCRKLLECSHGMVK